MKGNLLLGTAAGKLGDIVFSRQNGQQQARPRVTPKNPKSEAQCRQRMAFATISQAQSMLKAIINHSFQSVDYGMKSLNYFMKLNMPMIRAAAAWNNDGPYSGYNDFIIKGAKTFAVMPFTISQGSLTFPNFRWATKGGLEIPSVNWGDLNRQITDEQSYKNQLAMLNLNPGDQLTFVAILTNNELAATYGEAENLQAHVEYARVIFKLPQEIDFTQPFFFIDDTQGFAANAINFERSSNWANNILVTQATSTSNTIISPSITSGEEVMMAAIIRSARSDNGWLRSTANLVAQLPRDLIASADLVWPSYSDSTELVSNRYLNQANNAPSQVNTDEAYEPSIEVKTSSLSPTIIVDGNIYTVPVVSGENTVSIPLKTTGILDDTLITHTPSTLGEVEDIVDGLSAFNLRASDMAALSTTTATMVTISSTGTSLTIGVKKKTS